MAQRKSEVAGTFFPGDKDGLAKSVDDLLTHSGALRSYLPAAPIAVISPHAGYQFSGALTAASWNMTARCRPDRIAILSPSHRVAFRGIAVPQDHRAVSLPGMRVRLDTIGAERLCQDGHAVAYEAAFAREHGIDTQLPFADVLHPSVRVLPLVIGDAAPHQVAAMIDAVAAMEGETLFVLSSDLSHFLTQDQALAKDRATCGKIELGMWDKLTGEDACGCRAIAGFLASRAGAGARVLRMARTTSFAATQDASRVVGYGSWGLFPAAADVLPGDLRHVLTDVARKALKSRLTRGTMPEVRVDSFAVPLRTVMASFVTLELDGRLRGCIGSMQAHRALVQDVIINAVKAGFEDPRFAPITAAELGRVVIKVSVLTRPAPLQFENEAGLLAQMVPGETGLILQDGARRGTFLPSVWSSLQTPKAFLAQLKRKAGLPEDHWSDTVKAFAYRAEYFGEVEGAPA
ncbi:hypothetical protein PRI8871_02513 [Pseudoprimorskyibacter insulae]|uniref:AMMECR1 domain-containing protein n=2 Tax=Pseudoprimorskyibacter insulae TaxID=1695997 RepID=A0A2R8AXE8_9RHOB|nr:hypothetical protein PRI8871_02513 [Pseudoprimorskyibacter insulae]